jgi:primosomal protein N'
LIEFKSKQENEAIKHANAFAALLREHNSGFITLGPAAAALTKLKGMYRWHIVIKSIKVKDPSAQIVHKALQQTINEYRNSSLGKKNTMKLTVDVDPVGMM